ncbi:PAS domain S-box protein, partial [Planctomycetota bacterium]
DDLAVLESGISKLNYEEPQTWPDGTSLWLRSSKIPLRNADDEVVGVLGCYEDITQHKEAEQALRESEARFRRLTENAPDMIYRMGLPEGRYEYVSPATEAVTGYAVQEWYDRPELIGQIIHPDWHDYFQEQREKLLQGDIPPTYEYQIIDKAGKTRWLYQRNVLVKDENGHPVAIEGIVTDITDRRQAADEIRKAQALLMTAIEQTPAGILIADAPNVNIRLVNSAALSIRGENRESLTDIPMDRHPSQWKTYDPEGHLFAPEELPLSRAVLHGETVKNAEVIIERDDGERRWVLANAAPVRNKEGEVVYCRIPRHYRTEKDRTGPAGK